jgi:hypothetical protein
LLSQHCYRYVAQAFTQIVLAILGQAALVQLDLGAAYTQAQVEVPTQGLVVVRTQGLGEAHTRALVVVVIAVLAEVELTSGTDPTQIASE